MKAGLPYDYHAIRIVGGMDMLTPFELETYWGYFERMLESQTESEIEDWYECALALLRQVQQRQPYSNQTQQSA
jgi:hypothetical protein